MRLASTSAGLLLNLSSIQRSVRIHRAVVEPVAHAEREEILAAVHALGVEAQIFQRGARELGQLDGKEAIAVERMILQRVHGHLRLAQIRLAEVVEVDDQDAVGLQVGEIHFQRRGIHGDQRVDAVARRVDVVRGEMHLESADARKRAGRGANFGREVGKRGEIVAVQRDGIRELAAGDLHAVAGIAAEPDDGLVKLFARADARRS